jgi:hypothetical protein
MTSRQLLVAVLVVALLVMAVRPQPAEADMGVLLIATAAVAVVIIVAFLIVANVHESKTALQEDRPLLVVWGPPTTESP